MRSFRHRSLGERQVGIFRVSKVRVVSIIDDDVSVRVAVECLVRSLGFVACGFESAEDFLRSPRADDSSCVITDVQMRGMNGLELQSHLAAQRRCPPIIFITAFPEQSVRQRAQAAGALAFLEKPFDGGTMVNLLHEAMALDP
jgi:FixJ family two-component response regulator